MWSDGLALAEDREIWGDGENVNSGVIRPIENLGLIHSQYQRGECQITVDTARVIADDLSVLLDYLTGAAPEATRDQRMLERIDAIAKLSVERQATLLDVLDAYVRDAKTAKAYAA